MARTIIICSVCGEKKPLYAKAKCQVCYNKTFVRDKTRRWASRMKVKFGVTQEQYDSMLAAQGGCCAICGCKAGQGGSHRNRRLAVDHDHVTGKVRQLLCHSCNMILGRLADEPQLADRIAAYLRLHAETRCS